MTQWSEQPPHPTSSPATAPLPGLDEPDWTEIELSRGIPTSGLYLQLTVIWMQLMVSSRSTKTELFWVLGLVCLGLGGRGALAPDCHSWACLSNPHVTHKTELSPAWELGERDLGWSPHDWRGFGETWERTVRSGLNHHVRYARERNEASTGNSTFRGFLLHSPRHMKSLCGTLSGTERWQTLASVS